MARDLIRDYCEGKPSCEHYNKSTRECSLLRGNNLKEIFQEGKCNPSDMLHKAVKKNFSGYEDIVYPENPEHHIKRISFLTEEILKKQRLTSGFNLPTLQSYIHKAARSGVQKMVRGEKTFWEKICRNCLFLSLSKPFICQREKIPSGKENPFYGKKRIPSKDTCEAGFKPCSASSYLDTDEAQDDSEDKHKTEYLAEEVSIEKMRHEQTGINNKMEVTDGIKLLEERIQKTWNEKTKRIYERQYNIYCSSLFFFREGASEKEIINILADKLGVDAKTVRRDMKDIGKYLIKSNKP